MNPTVYWVVACFWLLSCFPALPAMAQTTTLVPAASPISFFDQGVAAVQMGDFALALESFTVAIANNDHLAAAFANRCLVEVELEHYDPAIVDCTEAIQHQPNNWEAFINRGLAHYRLGHFAAAIADNSHVLKANSQDWRAYNNRGLAQAALRHSEAAIADFQLALRYTPSTEPLALAEAHLNLGTGLVGVKAYTEAAWQLTRSIKLNPLDDRAYFNRGCLYAHQQNYQLAMQDFDQAFQLNPQSTPAQLNRAIALYNLGYTARVLADLRHAAQRLQQQDKESEIEQIQRLIDAIQRLSFLDVQTG